MEEYIKVIENGISLRKKLPTERNEVSSRSHALLTFKIQKENEEPISILMADLAGNERN